AFPFARFHGAIDAFGGDSIVSKEAGHLVGMLDAAAKYERPTVGGDFAPVIEGQFVPRLRIYGILHLARVILSRRLADFGEINSGGDPIATQVRQPTIADRLAEGVAERDLLKDGLFRAVELFIVHPVRRRRHSNREASAVVTAERFHD